MPRLAEVARRHGPDYLKRHGPAVLPSHVRALSAIAHCRTPTLGAHLGVCARCAHRHVLYHSCRHRACARCGFEQTESWLARQRELVLPVDGKFRTLLLDDSSDQYTLLNIIAADLNGDGHTEIVTRGSAQIRVLVREGSEWEGRSEASGCRDAAIIEVDSRNVIVALCQDGNKILRP